MTLTDQRQSLQDISSTMIRRSDPQMLQQLTYDVVIEYMQKKSSEDFN